MPKITGLPGTRQRLNSDIIQPTPLIDQNPYYNNISLACKRAKSNHVYEEIMMLRPSHMRHVTQNRTRQQQGCSDGLAKIPPITQ